MQFLLPFENAPPRAVRPFRLQLLKWVGSKQRLAHEIAAYFPAQFSTYYEPFLGSGGVLATLAPDRAVASDTFVPLMQIWRTLLDSPETLKRWYADRWRRAMRGDKAAGYERIKASYNANPNGADLVFLCRACYGGVVRFRRHDGYMSTPCGPHAPISPAAFARRVDVWRDRAVRTEFVTADYADVMSRAGPGDVVYCDPPYRDTQRILYGAQHFDLQRLFDAIESCKSRGACVALSIDGTKRSGSRICDVPVPDGLFEREVFLNCGRSMLKRFQMGGRSLELEVVADRLMLTY